MENRLIDLEIRFEYQERTINMLNEVLIAQQSQIDELVLQIRKLEVRLDSGAMGFGPANEKPPHY